MSKTVSTTRRGFIGSVAALCSTVRGVRADYPALSILPMNAVTLKVVVDNATFGPFLPDQNLPSLTVQRNAGLSSGAALSRRPLMAEFGLSVFAESKLGSSKKRVLVDFGYLPDVIRNNLSLLGIDAKSLDASVLSHGHLDHYGGFSGVYESADAFQRKLPLIVGARKCFASG